MIVKVQVSVKTTENRPQVLVYDRTRTFFYTGDVPPKVAALMGARKKAYFEAEAVPNADGAGVTLSIGAEVDEQSW